jgi:hypothetical protein
MGEGFGCEVSWPCVVSARNDELGERLVYRLVYRLAVSLRVHEAARTGQDQPLRMFPLLFS